MSRSDHDSAMTNGSSALLDDVIEEVANRLQAGDRWIARRSWRGIPSTPSRSAGCCRRWR